MTDQEMGRWALSLLVKYHNAPSLSGWESQVDDFLARCVKEWTIPSADRVPLR